MTTIRDYILRHIKIIIPVIVVAAVAAIVPVVLGATRARAENVDSDPTEDSMAPEDGVLEPEVFEDVPLLPNEDPEIYTLVATYYNATGMGDLETLKSVFDELSETDLMRYEENAKYLQHYSALEVYTMPGVGEGTTLAYVYYRVVFENHEEEEIPGFRTLYICRNDQGGLYIKNEKNFTQEETDYIKRVIEQENVIVFYNRVQVEYNDLMEAHPELLKYVGALAKTVEVAIGESLAEQIAAAEEDAEGEAPDDVNDGETENNEPPSSEDNTGEDGPQYATATATVNVRSSDSEQADKLGKVEKGTRLQVQEVRVNGWTKVLYEGRDGYIKSDYLTLEESVNGLDVIGTVTASQNINIRTAASTDAESLGILAGGESLDLFANEGEWCKVKYNNRVAYVKSEYVSVSQ